LFGLAAYVAEQRKKEMASGKYWGIGFASLVFVIRQFFIACYISCVIASPIAFYFLQGAAKV